jgi:hypothetical protein
MRLPAKASLFQKAQNPPVDAVYNAGYFGVTRRPDTHKRQFVLAVFYVNASIDQARTLLAADKKTALECLSICSEEDLAKKPAPAPWDPTPMILGHRLLQMVEHLKAHKGQLFYYLKLQGIPVDTRDYWGM